MFREMDLNNVDQPVISMKKEDILDEYNKIYSDTTTLSYKDHREKKTDPITYDSVNIESGFQFPYIWNPYTGKTIGLDPYGPLWFNPITMLKIFYISRLNGLSYKKDGYIGYGEYMGAGEDCEIIGRGNFPERYPFRLPICDCYYKINQKYNIITMGPKLTDREICKIDRLLTQYYTNSKEFKKIYPKIGSLFKMKLYFDVAVAKNPSLMDLSGLDLGSKDDAKGELNYNEYLNKKAIDVLRRM